MKYFNLYLIAAVVFVLILPAFLSFGIKDLPSGYQPSLASLYSLSKEYPLSQSFRANENGLNGVAMTIKNPNFRNKNKLIFELYSENEVLLRSIEISGFNIPDGDFQRFSFNLIPDSKNKIFNMKLSAPDTNNNDTLEIFLTKDKTISPDTLLGSSSENGNIAMVSFYKNSSPLNVTLKIYSIWISKLMQDFSFFIAYILIIVGLLLFIWRGKLPILDHLIVKEENY